MFSGFIGIKPIGPILLPEPNIWTFGLGLVALGVGIGVIVHHKNNEKCVLSKVQRLMVADATMKAEDCAPVKTAADRCASKVFQADQLGSRKSRRLTAEFGPEGSNLVYLVNGDEYLELTREDNLLLWNGTPVFRMEYSENVGFELYVVKVNVPKFKVVATDQGMRYEVQDDKSSKTFVYESAEDIPQELLTPLDRKGCMVFFESHDL